MRPFGAMLVILGVLALAASCSSNEQPPPNDLLPPAEQDAAGPCRSCSAYLSHALQNGNTMGDPLCAPDSTLLWTKITECSCRACVDVCPAEVNGVPACAGGKGTPADAYNCRTCAQTHLLTTCAKETNDCTAD